MDDNAFWFLYLVTMWETYIILKNCTSTTIFTTTTTTTTTTIMGIEERVSNVKGKCCDLIMLFFQFHFTSLKRYIHGVNIR